MKGEKISYHIYPDESNKEVDEKFDGTCFLRDVICDINDFKHQHFMCVYQELLKKFFFTQFEYWCSKVELKVKLLQEITIVYSGHCE